MLLQGKAALVTGSTSGIGLGIAEALAAQGCAVMLNGFGDMAEVEALRAGLERRFGVAVLYNGADLSDPAACAGLIRDTEERLGSCDVLVNNAGIQHVAAVEDFPPERWDAVIAVNLSSVFHAIHAAVPGMKRRGWGRIVNVASAHGLVASVNKAAYVAAKHGVIGLTKVVALETAEIDITCNAICPGWVLTPLVQKQIDARAAAQGISVEEAGRGLLSEKQPSKKFSTPEQIGGLTVFLCSPAADNLTGASLPVDGGWTAQ
jgi:3-hydroxybutyrate dehydrogenase